MSESDATGSRDRLRRARSLIAFPAMRREVVGAVEALSDPEYQERVWINGVLPHPNYYDEIALEVHILFDDIPILYADDDFWVGQVLFAAEVTPMKTLLRAFEAMVRDRTLVGDAAYLADPRWPDVVRLAGAALAEVRRSDAAHPDIYLGMYDDEPPDEA